MVPDAQRLVAKGSQGTAPSFRVVAACPTHPSAWDFGSQEGRHTVAADAMDEIKSLEAAIALLGEKNVLSQLPLSSLQTRSGQVDGASIAGACRVMQSVF